MNDSEQNPSELKPVIEGEDTPSRAAEPVPEVAIEIAALEVAPEPDAVEPEPVVEVAVVETDIAPEITAEPLPEAAIEIAALEVAPEPAAVEPEPVVEVAVVETDIAPEVTAEPLPEVAIEIASLEVPPPAEAAVDAASEVNEPRTELEPFTLSLDDEDEPALEVPGEAVVAPEKEPEPVIPIDWQSATEAILLAADKPVSIERLRDVYGEESPSVEELEAVLTRIAERHEGTQSGITLRKSLGGWQFATRAENARFVQRFLATKPFRLGRSALETLSIVAYRQPVTRAEIDQVRGIDSSHLLRVLMERGLVRMAGKADLPGRPVQYGTTPKFLETVGLSELTELPPLSELEQLKGDTPDPIKELEAGLDRFIQETPTPLEISTQATEGLGEIDALIEKAEEAPKEVFGSEEAAEVAKANEEALLAYQESSKKVRSARRKKTITFDELTGAPASGALPEAAVDATAAESEEISEPVAPAEGFPEIRAEEPPPETNA